MDGPANDRIAFLGKLWRELHVDRLELTCKYEAFDETAVGEIHISIIGVVRKSIVPRVNQLNGVRVKNPKLPWLSVVR
ncbi:MAG: hypothetical protein QOD90_3293 [Mycobacterium sp.]|jgi:hypothetical protein|nr:hypothetical protein [Mycobacterium sp.]